METDSTMVGNLTLPKRLLNLIDSGLWPRTPEEANRQNISSPISKERIQLFAPDEDKIYLYSPPFSTIATRMGYGDRFWSEFGALEQISPEFSVDIGDFGLGSDSPIVLDYRRDISSPTVIRLKLNPLLGETMPNGRTETANRVSTERAQSGGRIRSGKGNLGGHWPPRQSFWRSR